MAEHPRCESHGRLLLFEHDRHYFQKYVLGILWRGLSEEEKEQRALEAVKHRRARADDGVGEE